MKTTHEHNERVDSSAVHERRALHQYTVVLRLIYIAENLNIAILWISQQEIVLTFNNEKKLKNRHIQIYQ